MTNEVKHFGIPGMKWGVRKAKTTTHLRREGRKKFLVEKNKRGSTVSKRRVTSKEAKEFLEQRKADRIAKRAKDEATRERTIKIARNMVRAYAAVTFASLLLPQKTQRKIIGTIAWNTGKVVGNYPK